jgi:hypothetical protein
LVQICRLGQLSLPEMSARFRVPSTRLDGIAAQLVASRLIACNEGGLVATERGRALFDRMVEAHRTVLQRLAARWSPEQHLEAKAMLDGLAHSLIAELPIAPASSAGESRER